MSFQQDSKTAFTIAISSLNKFKGIQIMQSHSTAFTQNFDLKRNK